MGLDSSLITSFLDDCNIQYDVDDDNWVSFSYEENIFFGYVDSAGIIASCLDLGLPRIWEVPPIEKKKVSKNH